MRGKERGAGFTLVELMVVIVIVGLATSAVMLAMPDPGGSLQAEAERLAARAKAARDSAILEARPAALRLGPDGYALGERRRGTWRFVRHPWAEGTRIEPAGQAISEVRFAPVGTTDPHRLELARGDQRVTVEFGGDGTIHVHR